MTAIRRQVAAPLAAFATMGIFWGAWAALVPEIQVQTSASEPELGAALLWVGGGALPAMLLTGRLWARWGRGLVSVTLVLFGLASVLPALSPGVVFLAVSMALVGASSGALDVAMNSAISETEAGSGRRLMYLAHALFSLGVLFSSLSVGVLRELGVGPVPVLGSVALAFLGVALLSVLTDRRLSSAPKPAPPAAASEAVVDIRGTVVLLGILCAVAFLIEDALMSWSALHLERSLGATPAQGGAGPGLFAVAMFVGRSSGQFLGRRFGERDLLLGSGVLAAAGVLIAAWSPAPEPVLVGLVVAGAGVSIAAPALFSRAGRLAGPHSRGAAISTLTTLGYLGFVVGPAMVGFIAGATDLRVAFSAVAVLAALFALSARLLVPGGPPVPPSDEVPPVTRG